MYITLLDAAGVMRDFVTDRSFVWIPQLLRWPPIFIFRATIN